MGVQSLFINAWIREAQEASRLVENLEIKIENNPQQALGDTARSNLFDLGIKLDRLESLLHNPPSKPILLLLEWIYRTDRDLDFRWKMLSNIQLRTRMVFQSLYALPSKERSGNLATGDAKETSATDIGYYQDHTKVTFSQEDLELLMPLITDDATRSQLQITLSNSFASQNLHWRICRVILVILGGGAVFLLVLVIITAVV
ncbi:uncharacterized protein LOC104881413 isoform X1 [Vitis vinifera]|uniref:uncharacterized protein LOC104881413 isoform X1 n=1 Tax=Vitis vinifera TaxID=29760 RepID=UPI0005401CB1|nr:uncharacterized protein LOC104881413 isoform X1 [Vitis vinifera]|eukprot:XP_010659914.1 PREDICTED: uncharacterized protein LOC104881413 isoform X1 [Vitis vinifera]